ncbi:MAG: alpha/beta hydrolase domain-containing protein [Defluviitaleaceae bacterium]|nr:alpha/beta hydrolase domain-containing protein [Defluviitaleaceae bacterium]
MIQSVKQIPITSDSKPFAAAADTCSFDKIGYIEDEFFMSGTANIYKEGENRKPEVIFHDAPYTTRLLIRRPIDITKFSGNVVFEILNSTAGIDIDRMWVNSWQFFTRNGDIYVGITSKGHVVDALLKFDPQRYAPINWANPLPDRPMPAGAQTTGIFRFLPQFESGLFWDMLIDCAKLLKSDDPMNPIVQYPNRHIFLTGWSQSGFYIARYLKSFYDASDVLFSGYLSAGSGAYCSPLNAYESQLPSFGASGCLPVGSMMGAPEPVIAINTESENRMVYWQGDFDEPDFKFRTYQIAASSHDTKYCLLDYYGKEGLAMLDRIGISNGFTGVDGDPLDNPFEVIFNAAFYHLYTWARYGVPAPYAPPIETFIAYEKSTDPMGGYADNQRDVFGNCKGGIRTPVVDYPTGVYSSFSTSANDGTGSANVNPMFGKVNPFPKEMLKHLYGNISHYRRLVTEGTDVTIAQGFILSEDRDSFIAQVVQTAAERGL